MSSVLHAGLSPNLWGSPAPLREKKRLSPTNSGVLRRLDLDTSQTSAVSKRPPVSSVDFSFETASYFGLLKRKVLTSEGLYDWELLNAALLDDQAVIAFCKPTDATDFTQQRTSDDLIHLPGCSLSYPAVGKKIRFDLIPETGHTSSFLSMNENECAAWIEKLDRIISRAKEDQLLPASEVHPETNSPAHKPQQTKPHTMNPEAIAKAMRYSFMSGASSKTARTGSPKRRQNKRPSPRKSVQSSGYGQANQRVTRTAGARSPSAAASPSRSSNQTTKSPSSSTTNRRSFVSAKQPTKAKKITPTVSTRRKPLSSKSTTKRAPSSVSRTAFTARKASSLSTNKSQMLISKSKITKPNPVSSTKKRQTRLNKAPVSSPFASMVGANNNRPSTLKMSTAGTKRRTIPLARSRASKTSLCTNHTQAKKTTKKSARRGRGDPLQASSASTLIQSLSDLEAPTATLNELEQSSTDPLDVFAQSTLGIFSKRTVALESSDGNLAITTSNLDTGRNTEILKRLHQVYKTQIQEMQTLLDLESASLDKARQELFAARQEHMKEHNEVISLTVELEAATTRANRLEDKVEDLQRQLANEIDKDRVTNAGAYSMVEEYKRKVDALEEISTNCMTKQQTLELQVESLTKECADLRVEKRELEVQNQAQVKELNDFRVRVLGAPPMTLVKTPAAKRAPAVIKSKARTTKKTAVARKPKQSKKIVKKTKKVARKP